MQEVKSYGFLNHRAVNVLFPMAPEYKAMRN